MDENNSDNGPYKIKIDKTRYEVSEKELTGRKLRDLVVPPIPEDRDLFEELPNDDDRKVTDEYVVEIYDGKVFYTAPGRINPGT